MCARWSSERAGVDTDVRLRFANSEDLGRVETFYDSMSYGGGVRDSDLVLVADDSRDIVAAVRLCEEQGELVLRGMYVREDFQRRGLGTEMLHRLVPHLASRRCWCVPFEHLTGFYGQVGFRTANTETAPAFLRDRLERYRREGMEVTLVVRSSSE